MKAFQALATAQVKGFVRDKQTLFWVLAFPLMFLVLFGGIFTDSGQSRSSLVMIGPVPVVGELPGGARDAFDDAFEVTHTDDLEAALQQVRDGDVDAAVEQHGDRIVLHYSEADQVAAATVRGTFDSFVQAANQAVAQEPPTFTLDDEQVEAEALEPIQYVTPGLLGWAVAMGATFGAALTLVQWRTTKLLRRLRLSPVRTDALVGARTTVALGVALAQTVVFIGLGVGLFGLQLSGAWWMVVPLVLCGTLAFMAVGLLAGSVSKTAEGASGLANLVILPMAFLSGSFIPLEAAPEWLQFVAKFLPLGWLNEGMLDVMVRGLPPSAALVPMLVLLAFALGIGLLAAKVFRWEDD